MFNKPNRSDKEVRIVQTYWFSKVSEGHEKVAFAYDTNGRIHIYFTYKDVEFYHKARKWCQEHNIKFYVTYNGPYDTPDKHYLYIRIPYNRKEERPMKAQPRKPLILGEI